jgi:hypothetical protein
MLENNAGFVMPENIAGFDRVAVHMIFATWASRGVTSLLLSTTTSISEILDHHGSIKWPLGTDGHESRQVG